jgi:hypothetical protein
MLLLLAHYRNYFQLLSLDMEYQTFFPAQKKRYRTA